VVQYQSAGMARHDIVQRLSYLNDDQSKIIQHLVQTKIQAMTLPLFIQSSDLLTTKLTISQGFTAAFS
jgi:hypothetical protein